MGFVQGETIEGFLEKVGGRVIENLGRFVFQQLLLAVDFCHRKGKVWYCASGICVCVCQQTRVEGRLKL